MDVLALPPEVTSALIHTGPGAGSLIESSAAWQRLGVELEGLVGSYASVLSSLTETWTGPSASAMMQAVQPYLAWLRDLGQQAQQTAASAAAAAAATTGYFGLANQWGNQLISSGFPVNLLSLTAQLQAAQSLQAASGSVGTGLSEGAAAAIGGSMGNVGTAFGAAGLSAEPTAAVGVGVSMGKLTAPPAVVGLMPTSQAPVQLASAASPLPSGTSPCPPIPMAPMRRPQDSAGRRRRDGRDYEDVEYGLEVPGTVMPKPPSAG